MGFLATIARVNAAHPWSHNDAYAGFVLRHARAVRRGGGETAVDVGCGTGNLLRALCRVFPTTIGIEPDPDAAASAARQLDGESVSSEAFDRGSVSVETRHFGSEPRGAYDLIVFVASLHHMPLRPALEEARQALRPRGRVVIVGVARETPKDALHSGVSLLLNPLVGVIRHPRRASRSPAHMNAPTAEPSQSFDEIRTIASDALPGIRMRRRLFWRYTASWRAPS